MRGTSERVIFWTCFCSRIGESNEAVIYQMGREIGLGAYFTGVSTSYFNQEYRLYDIKWRVGIYIYGKQRKTCRVWW